MNSESECAKELVIGKLRELHSRDHNISGAQVDFFQGDEAGAKICVVDLTHYGEPLSVRKSAKTYEQAADDAVAELAREVAQADKPISS